MVSKILTFKELLKKENIKLLIRGMNYRFRKRNYSIVLMNCSQNALYHDKIINDGEAIIYEGHDVQKNYLTNGHSPKKTDQSLRTPKKRLTQNGLFFRAAFRYKDGQGHPEKVQVYEKISNDQWVDNGLFKLVDAWREKNETRHVYKFKLEVLNDENFNSVSLNGRRKNKRYIPPYIKISVYKRDKGTCQFPRCGKKDNLHFDHIIPISKGGSSVSTKNIQLMCAMHNLKKNNRINF